MNGMLIDSLTGDLLVRKDGGTAVGDNASQTAEGVIAAMRGEWKECPLIGGEARTLAGGPYDRLWPARTKRMLEACLVPVTRVTVAAGGVITVE